MSYHLRSRISNIRALGKRKSRYIWIVSCNNNSLKTFALFSLTLQKESIKLQAAEIAPSKNHKQIWVLMQKKLFLRSGVWQNSKESKLWIKIMWLCQPKQSFSYLSNFYLMPETASRKYEATSANKSEIDEIIHSLLKLILNLFRF